MINRVFMEEISNLTETLLASSIRDLRVIWPHFDDGGSIISYGNLLHTDMAASLSRLHHVNPDHCTKRDTKRDKKLRIRIILFCNMIGLHNMLMISLK